MNFKKLLLQSLVWRSLYFFSLLLVNIFLSRYLQAATTGWVYYISTVFNFSFTLLGIGLDGGVTYFASGKIINANKLLWFSVAWSAFISLFVFIGVYVYLLLEPGIAKTTHDQYYFYGFCYIIGVFLTNCGAAMFYSQNNFFLPNFLLIIWNTILIILIPRSIETKNILDSTSVLRIYFSIFLLQGISVYIAYIIKNKSIKELHFPDLKELKWIFKYSSLVLLASVIFFLVYRIDYLFVNISPVCTAADLGNYIQVSKLGQLFLVIPQIIASVIFPRSASGINRQELNNSVMTMGRLFSQLYFVILGIVLLTGNWIFTLIFGETFNKMQLPFIILVPGIFSLSVLALLSAYFSGKGKVRVNVTGATLALMVMIIGDYLFVPLYGIVAAAIVSTLSYTVNLAYSLYIFYKDYSISLIDFFRWRKDDYNWLRSLLAGSKD